MKTRPALFLLSLPIAAGLAAKDDSSVGTPAPNVEKSDQLTPGGILAAQVGEIARTKDLSDHSKSRQIASAVRLAVTTSTTNLKSPEQALNLVLDLATRAAKAAPDFADVITEAALDAVQRVPLLADLAGVKDRVQDAVFAGVKAAAEETGEARFESNPAKPPAAPEFGGKTDDVIVSPSH